MSTARNLLARTKTVADAQAALEGLIALAFTDPTTGLHNRRALDEILKLPLAFEGPVFGVVMIDLTGFKRVNDEGSHAAGDAALARVGETLAEMCHREGPFATALPFRYGGDEFCILVPQEIFEAFVAAEHLSKLSWREFVLQDKPLGFGGAVGIAEPDEEIGLIELLARADVAATVSKGQKDKPVRWTTALEHEETISRRKRCGSCSATVMIQVAATRLRPDQFKVCPNCGEAL